MYIHETCKGYIFPKREVDVQFIDNIKTTWQQVYIIEYNTPTIIVFEDNHFILVYQGICYGKHGGGAIKNPWANNHFVKVIQDTVPFSYNYLLEHIVRAKWKMLKKLFPDHDLPFYWATPEYKSHMYGLLIGKLDLIGFGKLPITALIADYKPVRKLLL